jgi:hypothetical protein
MEGTPGTQTPQPPPTAAEPTAENVPSRWQALFGNRKRLLLALGLLLVAAAVAVGSTAVFTSSSANPGNAFTAGTLEVSGDNGAILTADKMVPGQSVNGSATIENTGDVSGAFSLTGEITADAAGPQAGAAPLSEALQLTITEGATTVYSGAYDAFPGQSPVDLGSWGGGDSHTYDFTVTFPEGGPSDNQFQGGSTAMKFTWDAVSE